MPAGPPQQIRDSQAAAAERQAAPYGRDRFGNPLPPPGQFAPSGSGHYEDGEWVQEENPNSWIPNPLPQVTADPQPEPTPQPQPAPGPAPRTSTPNYGGDELTRPFTGQFTPPAPQALPQVPVYTPPQRAQPPPFAYDEFHAPGPFVAPDEQAALNDPGFKFSRDQSNEAFMANRAASQTAHTGGTIKDFLDWNKNMNSQQYAQVYGRAADTYDRNYAGALNAYSTNRANAVGTYNTNYQTQYQDPWNYDFQASQAAFAPRLVGYQTDAANIQHENDIRNSNALNQWYQDYNIFRNTQNDTFDKRFRVATA